MRYKVLKSSMDGISGGASRFDSIEEVLKEISYHKGWDTLKQLHAAIKRWAKEANPGSVFTTQVTAIVAVAVDRFERQDDVCHHCGFEGPLDYDEMEPVGECEWDIQQKSGCPKCGRQWLDTFVLSGQCELFGGNKKKRINEPT